MLKKEIITLIGNDGSGKTYQAKKIFEEMKKNKIPAKVIHFDHFFLKIPKFAASNKYLTSQGEEDQSIRLFKTLKGNKIFQLVFPIIAYIDFLFFYIFKIIFVSEKIVILDRYFYDKLIKFYDLNICNQKIFNLLLSIAPVPNLTLYLNLSPKVGFKRKEEMTVSILSRRKKLYDKLVKDFGFIVINADKKKDKVFLEIIEKLKYVK
ncbi:MAG: hypothetical protein HYT07_02525 [Candidatus Levybacteria bacterium]|nr:hypothetical protein [Candidatus Levybacteria bacterium]